MIRPIADDVAEMPALAPTSGPRQATRTRRWRMPWLSCLFATIILVGAGVFLYPYAASWVSDVEQSQVTELTLQQLQTPPNNDEKFREAQLERAREYNDALASGAVLPVGGAVPEGEKSSDGDGFEYQDLLTIRGTDVMGRIRYDALGIDLPIRHGTGPNAIEHGVGHLEGTSLPIGGTGNRSVLTSHRGLPEATLFTDLNQAKKGDTFSVTVMDQVLVYQVVEIKIIDPSDIEVIEAVPGRDLVTLITCTPLGVNTQRIVVTGERVTPTPIEDTAKAHTVPAGPGFPLWALTLGATAIGLGVYVWRSGRVVDRPVVRGEHRPRPVDAEDALD